MTIDKKVNEVPLETVTISVLQYRFPREVLKELEAKGCAVKERIEGIFEISGGPVIFPFQIIDAVILGPEWDVLKVLVPGATEKQIIKIQEEYEQADNDLLKKHLADVLRTAFESNEALFSKMKEAGKMSEAVERVFKKEIEEAAEKKEEQVVTTMLQNNEPADKIVKYFGWTPERVMTFAKKIGITTLTL